MKALILTSLLVMSFSSFAYQNSADVDCTALSESTERVNNKSTENKKEKKKNATTVKKDD